MNRVVSQHSATLLVPVHADKSDCLRQYLLAEDERQLSAKGPLSPATIKQVHLLSASLIPSFGHADAAAIEPGGNEFLLVLEINYDGNLKAVCSELWEHAREFLIRILDMCECKTDGYRSNANGLQRLLEGGIKEKIFFTGVRGISMLEIRRKDEIRKKAIILASEISGTKGGSDLTARELCKKIEARFRSDSTLNATQIIRPRKVRYGPELSSLLMQGLVILVGALIFLGSGAWGTISLDSNRELNSQFPGFLMFLVVTVSVYIVCRTRVLQSTVRLAINFFIDSINSLLNKKIKHRYGVPSASRMWTREDAISGFRQVPSFKQFSAGAMALIVLLFVSLSGFPAAFAQHSITIGYIVLWALAVAMVVKRIRTWEYIEVYIHRLAFVFLAGMLLLMMIAKVWQISELGGLLQRWPGMLQHAATNLLVLVGFSYTAVLISIGLKLKVVSRWSALVLVLIAIYGLIQSPLKSTYIDWIFVGILIFAYVIIYLACKLRAQERVALEAAPHWPNDKRRETILFKEAKKRNRANQLISVTQVKPHRLRRLTLRGVLWVVNLRANWRYTRGELSGIETIYFAQWYLIDGGQRLLFITNYFGDWDRYLDEFIDSASTGITAIWSNTEGFPRSSWVIGEGSRQEEKFKAYARASQVPTQFYYCAYPELSVTRIQDNIYLTDLLRKNNRSDAECDVLVSLL